MEIDGARQLADAALVEKRRATIAKTLTPQQQSWIFEVIAGAKALDKPVLKALNSAWQERYGADVPRSVYQYYVANPACADRRIAAETKALIDMRAAAQFHPTRQMQWIEDGLKLARTPRVVGYQAISVLTEEGWKTNEKAIKKPDLNTYDKLVGKRESLLVKAGALGGGVNLPEGVQVAVTIQGQASAGSGNGKRMLDAKQIKSGMYEIPGMEDDVENAMTPEEEALLVSQEGQPFGMSRPQDVRVSYEQHRAEMKRWNDLDQPPSWTENRKVEYDGPAPVKSPEPPPIGEGVLHDGTAVVSDAPSSPDR